MPEQLKPEVGEATFESAPIGAQPWNFPYDQLARFTAPNIMACNVVMVKHANIVAQCAIASERRWRDTGALAGVYTNLLISQGPQVANGAWDGRGRARTSDRCDPMF